MEQVTVTSPKGRARGWLFTSFDIITEETFLEADAKFGIWQLEQCPKTGRKHYQGYVVYNAPIGFDRVKRDFYGSHVEIRRGTHDEAVRYCSKEDTRLEGPYVYGDDTGCGQGKRSDLAEIKTDIGLPVRELSEKHFVQYVRYFRGIERFKFIHSATRRWKTKVVIIFGPPGTGKTSAVFDYAESNNLELYIKPASTKWWDGYDGQPLVLFDDYNDPWFTWDCFLRILNDRPEPIETKFGFTQLLAKEIFITSNLDFRTWYPQAGTRFPIEALIRRVDTVIVTTVDADPQEFKTDQFILKYPL